MTTRKLLLIMLALLGSTTLSAFAGPTALPVQVSYERSGDDKRVTTQKLSSTRFWYRANLVWARFDERLHRLGFRFGEARSVQVVRPELPPGCKVFGTNNNVMGQLGGSADSSGTLQFALEGELCSEWGGALLMEPVVIRFEGVPASNYSLTYPLVELSLTETIL